MSNLQFNCPLCSGLFEIATSSSGQQVECPHCQGVVQIPDLEAEAPPVQSTEPPIEPPIEQSAEPHVEQRDAPEQPPVEQPPVEQPPDNSSPPVQTADSPTESASRPARRMRPVEVRGRRESRRFMRNLIVWLMCAILMIAVIWMLLVRGPLS